MKRIVTLTISTVLFALAAFALPAFADSQVRIVRLSYLNGSVQIDRNTKEGFERAIMNMPITQGAQLRTQDGQAEVEFENGSSVRLSPETQVAFDGLTLREDGSKLSIMKLQKGVAYFDLNRKDKNEFRLLVAGREIELKKSAHFRVDMSHDRVRLAVFGGEISVPGPDTRIAVKKNKTFSFDPAEQNLYALNKGVDEYQSDTWDRQREKYQDQYTKVSYSHGSPYYGWDDLNYYGSFSFVPGWGYMWRPFGVGLGWDPFAVGYWAWYPWGYTWVSPYAWGWTPYRYGGWGFVPGYGWGWMPGSGGHSNWHPAPPVNSTPPGWKPPQPPSGTQGGIVTIGHPHPIPPRVTRSFVENAPGIPERSTHRSAVQPLPTPNLDGPPVGVNRGGLKRGSVTFPSNSGTTSAGIDSRRQQPSAPVQAGRPDAGSRGSDNQRQSAGTSSTSGTRSSGSFGGSGSQSGGMGASRPMSGGDSMRGSAGGGHTGGSGGSRNPR